MNLEPAILLILNSVPRYIDVTSMLLDCLFRHMTSKNWILGHEIITLNVQHAMNKIVSKGVISNLSIVVECQQINQTIRDTVKNYFPNEIKKIQKPGPKLSITPPSNQQQVPVVSGNVSLSPPPIPVVLSPQSKSPPSPFSEVSLPITTTQKSMDIFKTKTLPSHYENLLNSFGQEMKVEHLEKILDLLERETDQEIISKLGKIYFHFNSIFIGEYMSVILSFEFKCENPKNHQDRILSKDSFLKFIFGRIQRDPKDSFELFLKSMMKFEPSIGYRILLNDLTNKIDVLEIVDLLDISFNVSTNPTELYSWFLKKRISLDEENVFLNDLRIFSEENISLLVSFLPLILKYFKMYSIGSIPFYLNLISNSNPILLEKILNLVSTNRVKEFIGSNNILKFISNLKEFDFYEKEFFWNLFLAERFDSLEVDEFLDTLLKNEQDPSIKIIPFLAGMMPNYDSFKLLMISKSSNGFSSNLISHYLKNFNVEMLNHLISLLKELTINPSTNGIIIQNVILNLLTIKIISTNQQSDLFNSDVEIKKWIVKLKEFNLLVDKIDLILEEFSNKRKIEELEDEPMRRNSLNKKRKIQETE
jgi:hypothetical protein